MGSCDPPASDHKYLGLQVASGARHNPQLSARLLDPNLAKTESVVIFIPVCQENSVSLGFPRCSLRTESFLLCFGFCLFLFCLWGEGLIPQFLEREIKTGELRIIDRRGLEGIS